MTNEDSAKTISVAIIGAGNIACGFDAPDSKEVLTHAHAFSSHTRTRLVALVDTDRTRGVTEAKRWNTNYYPSIEEMLAKENPGVIVIATPDDTHTDLLVTAIAANPKLIICEKPAAVSASDVARVREISNNTKVPVLVNFTRRFDTTIDRMQKNLTSGKFGKIISAQAAYGRGIHHKGSHTLNLAQYFFGNITGAKAQFSIEDYVPSDLSYGGFATFEHCTQFYLTCIDGRATSIFEFDIFTDRMRVTICDEGNIIKYQDIIADPLYEGFKMLGPERREPTELTHAFEVMADHAVAVVDGVTTPKVPLAEALSTYDACEMFADSFTKR